LICKSGEGVEFLGLSTYVETNEKGGEVKGGWVQRKLSGDLRKVGEVTPGPAVLQRILKQGQGEQATLTRVGGDVTQPQVTKRGGEVGGKKPGLGHNVNESSPGANVPVPGVPKEK